MKRTLQKTEEDFKSLQRPKKQKFSAFELLPWNKEVTQGSPRLEDLSFADLEWAEAVNRLPEQFKVEGGKRHGSLPLACPKNRLMMTTHFMQQLFCPPPAVICSGDVTSNWGSMTFFAARLALGDACSLASRHSLMPHEGSNSFSGKRSTSKTISCQEFSKNVEEVFNWSKRLEVEIFRLEKGAVSIVDMWVEFQELEKFALISRLLKFHSRRQVIRSAVPTTPSVATPNALKLKLSPQRYVTAIPMPKTIPEGAVQGISL